MSKPALTLSFGLLLAASGFAVLHTAELRVRSRTGPALPPGLLCVELALQAAPGRLITQMQPGVAAMLNCPRWTP